jgi:hypothetical protein
METRHPDEDTVPRTLDFVKNILLSSRQHEWDEELGGWEIYSESEFSETLVKLATGLRDLSSLYSVDRDR